MGDSSSTVTDIDPLAAAAGKRMLDMAAAVQLRGEMERWRRAEMSGRVGEWLWERRRRADKGTQTAGWLRGGGGTAAAVQAERISC